MEQGESKVRLKIVFALLGFWKPDKILGDSILRKHKAITMFEHKGAQTSNTALCLITGQIIIVPCCLSSAYHCPSSYIFSL